MSEEPELSEEYLANLLKKDAEKLSASYTKNGTYDVMPKKPAGSSLKPNTRFLRNIIRSTDNHNAALKQRELGNAAERLRDLSKEDYSSERKAYEEERRRARKRKRNENRPVRRNTSSQEAEPVQSERYCDRSTSPYLEKRHRHSKRDREERRRRNTSSPESARPPRDRSKDRETGSDRRSRRSREDCNDHAHEHRRRHSKSRSRDRKQSSRKHDRDEKQTSKRDHSRSRHRRRSRSRSPVRKHRRNRHKYTEDDESIENAKPRSSKSNGSNKDLSDSSESNAQPRKPPTNTEIPKGTQSELNNDEDDDDPLTAILGPIPAPPNPAKPEPVVRGRGATSYHNTSNKTDRFSSSYNPSADTLPSDNDNEDWDQALEALHDRAQFKQAGRDRLLAAGFSKAEVDRMERGGERSESDVVWKGKGEGREWDRGKVLDGDGEVEVDGKEHGYGRLV